MPLTLLLRVGAATNNGMVIDECSDAISMTAGIVRWRAAVCRLGLMSST